MKINKIEISNFRSIANVEMNFQTLMMFIGQNNHGKSNMLYAILFFFGEIKIQELDFFNDSDELFVEIEFDDLDDDDKNTFKKYLTNENKILVRKTAYKEGSFQYNGYIQNPVHDYLKEDKATNFTTRGIATTLPLYEYLPQEGRITKANIIEAQKLYILAHEGEIEFNYELEETNFLGLKSVAQGIFGDVFFIPAVKNINDDLSNNKTSIFTKLYSKVIDIVTSNDADIQNIKGQVTTQFQKLKKYSEDGTSNIDRPIELNQFEDRLSSNLRDWGVDLEVEIIQPDIDDVFKSNVNIWIHDGIRTDINRKGHGLQRALTFSLIKTLSEHVQAEAGEEGQTRQASKSSYFIFEEPELYLHPQAQRSLLDSLIRLSTGSQVVLCTHSSSLISLKNYKSISIVRKDITTNKTEVTYCQEELFTGNGKQNFNLLSWINPDRAELFFAKKVILLEGATEKTVIPFLANKLGIFKYEYTLIDCGSKDSISSYINLLNKFSIPYVAVYDKDNQAIKGIDAITTANASSQRVEDAIDGDIGKSVIFINDIEEELGMTAGTTSKPYIALQEISKEEFVISTSFSEKITRIYE